MRLEVVLDNFKTIVAPKYAAAIVNTICVDVAASIHSARSAF
jgi:hypothetical protein